MKPEDILEVIGNVDEAYVKKAKGKKKSHKRMWITIGSIAASVIVVCMLSIVINGMLAEKNADKYLNDEEIVIACDDVWIYYVTDSEAGDLNSYDNTISEKINRQKEYLPLSPDEIFGAWKLKNKIGEDVKLIEVKIDSNSKTNQSEFEDEGVVKHEIGDYYVYNITISKSIENYYDTIESEILLDTLKRTMTGYSDIEFDEYNLTLQ